MSERGEKRESRRTFLKAAVGAAGAFALGGLVPLRARAEGLPHLKPSDPTAQALGYTEDAAKVDAKKYPKYAKGQMCSNCQFYQGKPGDAYGPCQIFSGKAVHSKGWCNAYAKKPS